jgi:hypothetical protein
MKAIDYRIKAQIKGETPDIQLEVIYKDDFTNDHYVLKSLDSKEGAKSINFLVFKNGEDFGNIVLKEKDVQSFLNEFLKKTEDADLVKEFKKQLFPQIEKEINNFFEFFDDAIILKGVTVEGELKRMKKVAGILKG